jgi:hypothetical protein
MPEVKMVNVKLAARCLVNGQIREAGEIVDLQEKALDAEGNLQPFAAVFGEIIPKKVAEAEEKAAAEAEEAKAVVVLGEAEQPKKK